MQVVDVLRRTPAASSQFVSCAAQTISAKIIALIMRVQNNPLTYQRLYLSPSPMSGREQRYAQEVFAPNWIAPLGPQVDAASAFLRQR